MQDKVKSHLSSIASSDCTSDSGFVPDNVMRLHFYLGYFRNVRLVPHILINSICMNSLLNYFSKAFSFLLNFLTCSILSDVTVILCVITQGTGT